MFVYQFVFSNWCKDCDSYGIDKLPNFKNIEHKTIIALTKSLQGIGRGIEKIDLEMEPPSFV